MAPDAIVLVDREGISRRANEAVYPLFGYEPGELIGHSVGSLMPARFRAAHQEHFARYVNQPRVREMGAGLDLFGRRKGRQ